MSLSINKKGNKFVGIIRPTMLQELGNTKRLLLMFDGLVLDLSYHLPSYENKIIENNRDEIDYLADEGLIITLGNLEAEYGNKTYSSINPNDFWIGKSNAAALRTFTRAMSGVGSTSKLFTSHIDSSKALRYEYDYGRIRYTASQLRLTGIDAVAIPTEEEQYNIDGALDRQAVIEITLNNFPIPSEQTAWESIIDFKKSDKAMEQFRRLKVWMNEMATKEKNVLQFDDELRSLIASYEYELNLREIQLNKSALSIIITTSTEILQKIATLKFAEAAKTLFSIKSYKLDMLEEEKKVPGREIAYISSARAKFG